MNKQSFCIVTLFVICAISVSNVSCQVDKYNCMAYNEYGCKSDSDCCTENCVHGCKLLMGTCDVPKGALEIINGKANDELGSHGICKYIRESNVMLRDYYYQKFNVHAANSKLPANSEFAIYANNSVVAVTMSDDRSRSTENDDGITFLSEEAAKALGVTENGTVFACKVLKPYRGKLATYLVHGYYYLAMITPIVAVITAAVSLAMKYVAV